MLAKGSDRPDGRTGSGQAAVWHTASLPSHSTGAGGGSDRTDFARLVEWARELERHLKKLCDRLSRLEELLGSFEFDFVQFVQRLSGAADVPPLRRRGGRRAATAEEEVIAYRGVSAVAVEPCADESAHVRLDGSKPVKLSRGLANLLAALVRERVSTDHLVGWKPIDEVAAELSSREGAPVSRRAVINRIWRLREALFDAGSIAGFVHLHRTKGVRFALRRAATDPAPSVTEPSA